MEDKQLEGSIHAPDFPAGLSWFNTDHPLSLNDLKGKIVLLDFWTFCCINCMHIIPDLKKLEAKYSEELVVVGVHSAKFTNEKQTDAIRQAVLRYEIAHPVVNDADFEIWNLYNVHSWPTLVLINPNGRIIGFHSGEGIFESFDEIIGRVVQYFETRGELRRGPLKLSFEAARKPQTLLSFPGKIHVDSGKRRLFITDSNHNRVIITDPGGAILDVIGGGVIGQGDGSFESTQFNHPQGSFLDGDILYIADTENHLIRAADLETRTVKTILGTGQQAHDFSSEGVGRAAALNSPWDLLVYDGKLYIAMAGPHQLWVADLKTLRARPYAGSGREGRLDGNLRNASLAQPSGIATDGKKLFFADSETSSIRSADLDESGRVETIIGEDLFVYGDIDGSAHTARLQHPLGVTYKDGLIYVADTYNSKIKIIDPIKKRSITYAGTGQHGLTDGPLPAAQFNEPSGLAFLGDILYIADANNHQIRVIDTKSGTVGTLEFSHQEKINRSSMDNFAGRIVQLDPQRIRAGKAAICLSINLPIGYELTKDASFYLEWKSDNDNIVSFTAASDEYDFNKLNFPLTIPVTASKGESEIEFNAVIYFCPENSNLCLFDNIRLKFPVIVDNAAPERLNLTLDVKTY